MVRSSSGPQVRYIGSHEMLPPPLSLDEETVLMEKLRTGEIYVRSELVERNLRLVVYIARKFESTELAEDLVSIGTIGLIKAVNTFDPDKRIKLATYVSSDVLRTRY